MSFPRHWKGSIDPTELGGVAHYMINGRQYKLWMTSFRNFTLVGDLLDYVFEMGLNHGKEWMASRVREAITASGGGMVQPEAIEIEAEG
jgi:hypothetical protein